LKYPRIVYTDVNGLWLLAEWHEISRKPFYHPGVGLLAARSK
jgi:hypothetical protein